MIFRASVRGAQHERYYVEKKPESLVVLTQRWRHPVKCPHRAKTLNEMPPSLCGGQGVGPSTSSLPVVVAQSN